MHVTDQKGWYGENREDFRCTSFFYFWIFFPGVVKKRGV